MKIQIGETSYYVDIANTAEARKTGLQGVSELPKDKGMLFLFDEGDEQPKMWMKGVLIPLDIAFIGNDSKVIDVIQAAPGNEQFLSVDEDVMAVLEVNANSPIQRGDSIEVVEDESPEKTTEKFVFDYLEKFNPTEGTSHTLEGFKEIDGGIVESKSHKVDGVLHPMTDNNKGIATYKVSETIYTYGVVDRKKDGGVLDAEELIVYDDKGNIQMVDEVGARIFSIPHTKKLVSLAANSKDPKDFIKLALSLRDILTTQDTQKKEFVD